MIKKYTADFETSTWNEEKTWVWAYALCEIGNEENIILGNNLDDFMKWCEENNNPIIYFHNLKFDSSFILSWLFNNDFKLIHNSKERNNKTFTTLITDMGQFFSLTVYFKVKGKRTIKVTFYDSLKILPFSVDKIAKSFNLPISKLEIDYNEEREIGHILTLEEQDYIKNDVKIVAMALNVLFNQKLTKMTQASNAMSYYKQITGENKFNHYFPKLPFELDKDLRKSYKRWIYIFKSKISR